MDNNRVALIEIGCSRPENNEPIGICTIAAYLEHASSIHSNNIDLFWQRLKKYKYNPDYSCKYSLIGISAQINTLDFLENLYEQIKERAPNIPIVVGNLIGIYAADYILGKLEDVIVCEGEGEIAFAEIYSSIVLNNGSISMEALSKIDGLAYLQDGKIVRTHRHLTDLSLIPPPRRYFTEELVKTGGVVRIEASRGCHWGRCEFCSVTGRYGNGNFRRFDLNRILGDLQTIAELGARSPYFSDEDFFGGDYQKSIELAREISDQKKRGTLPKSLNFFVSILASDVTHNIGKQALNEWKKAGLREVFVGIETGSSEEIRRFDKKSSVKTNSDAIKVLQEMGFQIDIGFIMFDPEMTLEDIKKNLAWLSSREMSEIDSRVTKSLRIQPKTAIKERYNDLITGPVSVDDLQYPYQFKDIRVSRVKEEYEVFEKLMKIDVYSLLGSARGEIGDENIRLSRKRRLAKIRYLDLAYLTEIVSRIENGNLDYSIENFRDQVLTEKRSILNLEG